MEINIVGSGMSRAALSNCGNRAQERFGRAALARDRASTAARRTRAGQENKRFTDEGKRKNWSPIGASFTTGLRAECAEPARIYSGAYF